jgi:hypothetical protein
LIEEIDVALEQQEPLSLKRASSGIKSLDKLRKIKSTAIVAVRD